VLTGLTAEAAIERVQSDTRARMLRETDPYLRERLHDLEDLAHRLMRQLTRQEYAPARESLPKDAVLIANSMRPWMLREYARGGVRGLVLEEDDSNSTLATVAREFGIVTVTGVKNIISLVNPGDVIVVDGDTGDIYIFVPRRRSWPLMPSESALRDSSCWTGQSAKSWGVRQLAPRSTCRDSVLVRRVN
jgi:phosphotransferase system, enzyme I, PtsP